MQFIYIKGNPLKVLLPRLYRKNKRTYPRMNQLELIRILPTGQTIHAFRNTRNLTTDLKLFSTHLTSLKDD